MGANDKTNPDNPKATPDQWMAEIRTLVVGLKNDQNDAFDKMRAENVKGHRTTNQNVELLRGEFFELRDRVEVLEKQPRYNTSDRVRSIVTESVSTTVSNADLQNEAAISEEIIKRQQLADEVQEIKSTVGKIDAKQDSQIVYLKAILKFGNRPIVKSLGAAIAGAIIMALGIWTQNLKARVPAPLPAISQPAK